ncbi:hypothetical protein D3C72_1007540 [compost metagenome]
MEHVGGEGLAHADVGDVGGDPLGIGLITPVEEGLLPDIEAIALIEGRQAIALYGIAQPLERLGQEGTALPGRQRRQHLLGRQRPTHAVGADGPAAPRPRILNDLTPLRDQAVEALLQLGPEVGELELQGVPRPLRIQDPQPQIGGVGEIPRPDIMPLGPRFEAVAGDRLTAAVAAILDLGHAVLPHLVRRQRKQGIKHHVARAQPGQIRLLLIRGEAIPRIPQLLGRRLGIAAIVGPGLLDREGGDFLDPGFVGLVLQLLDKLVPFMGIDHAKILVRRRTDPQPGCLLILTRIEDKLVISRL